MTLSQRLKVLFSSHNIDYYKKYFFFGYPLILRLKTKTADGLECIFPFRMRSDLFFRTSSKLSKSRKIFKMSRVRATHNPLCLLTRCLMAPLSSMLSTKKCQRRSNTLTLPSTGRFHTSLPNWTMKHQHYLPSMAASMILLLETSKALNQ